MNAASTTTRHRTASTTGRAPASWLRHVLRLDTVVGVVTGLAMTALASPLATQLDTGTGLVVVLGLLFVGAGVVNGWAARDGARLPTLFAVDLDLIGSVVATALLVLASPTGLGIALLVATAVWTAVIAALKVAGLRAGG